ncbi:hypothetical protein [Gallibacterium salpingitidis]|uniref:hypothetical protein n=1 Tax=Gallibacterium salpingitidis TaxID=505341 RepID=UPI0012E94EAB|nr:hypothetical protein [Gallibacterium salpingitidis]
MPRFIDLYLKVGFIIQQTEGRFFRIKYTQTFEQQVIDFYFKHHESMLLSCRTFNIH